MRPASVFRVVSSTVMFAMVSSAGAQTLAPAGENRLQFAGGRGFVALGPGSDHMEKMRERLQDPQQRAALREEHRGYIVDSHYDAAEVLELDAATYDKLIELLTDQQMEQLDEFHLRAFSPTAPPDMASHLQSRTERHDREIKALRELLGQQTLERLQAYRSTLGERRQVRELDSYLKSTDKLSRTQREQMVEVFRSHFHRVLLNQHSLTPARSGLLRSMLRDMPSQEDLQRQSQLMTIESSEDNWRRTPEFDRRLREQAAPFLTAPQLSALEQLHADKLKRLQQSIEEMRVQAGLSPNIPAQAEAKAAASAPAKVDRDVRIRMKIAVNQAKPATFTEIASSGKPFTFEVDEGLLVQVTPTVFDNDTYDLRVEYFEQGATGRRLIGHMGSAGKLDRVPPVADALMGSSGSVVTGSKAYGIELSTSVEPI